MRVSTIPQHPIPLPDPIPPEAAIGTYERERTTSVVKGWFRPRERIESTHATKGWITQSEPQVWTGSFDAVQAELMLAIARSDERNAAVDDVRYEGFGPHSSVIDRGERRGQTPAHLIAATDDPTRWSVSAITAVELYDYSYHAPKDPWRYVGRRIDADDPTGTSKQIATNAWAVSGLPAQARAIVDSTRAVPVVDGRASWTTRGHDFRPKVVQRSERAGRSSVLP